MISTPTLLAQVRSTAPFLELPAARARGDEPLAAGLAVDGWKQLLADGVHLAKVAKPAGAEADRYFGLCLACHHATVATFVPTDVDSKIRGRLWADCSGIHPVRRRAAVAVAALRWNTTGVSTRDEPTALGVVSGHQGEADSVILGALAAAERFGDTELMAQLGATLEAEVARQAAAFDLALAAPASPDHDRHLLRLTMLLAHNAGDLNQGISYWPERPALQPWRDRFGDLCQDGATRFGGSYLRATQIYKALLAPEGHRHYPLRALRALRRDAALLLPVGPWLEPWGATLATHPALGRADRGELLAGLLLATRSVPNQVGYFRAVAGMLDALGPERDRQLRDLPPAAALALRHPDQQRHLAISADEFATTMGTAARTAVA